MAQQENKKGSKKGLIIAFVIILLAINGVQLFFNIKQNNDITEKTATIDSQKKSIDSLDLVLDGKISELKTAKEELERLGANVTELEAKIKELEEAKEKLQKQANYNYSRYISLKRDIDTANKLRDDALKQVEDLKLQLAQQDTIIQTQKQAIVKKEDEIRNLNATKQGLEQKVAIASVLKAEGFSVTALNSKGKGKEGTEFKAKTIDKLKVSFTLAENKVAEKGGKDIIFRVIEPDGNALYDTEHGGGTFEYQGKEVFYSMKNNILFENNSQKLTFEYQKGSAYKPGKHTIEIYADGFKIGESSFLVKK